LECTEEARDELKGAGANEEWKRRNGVQHIPGQGNKSLKRRKPLLAVKSMMRRGSRSCDMVCRHVHTCAIWFP
jgi:hypothetical protein